MPENKEASSQLSAWTAPDAPTRDVEEQNVLDDLAAQREELAITIHDLVVSKPSTLASLIGVQFTLVLLIGALALVVVPYFEPGFPRQVSTLAAFLAVILAFAAYISLRKFSIEYEQRRLYTRLIKRAEYLARIADDLLSRRAD